MQIWLIKDGENLPLASGVRLMRTGMLAQSLVTRGRSAVWWCSTFSHQRKRLLFAKSTEVHPTKGLLIKLMHAGEYSKNISFRRYRHHRALARSFRDEASRLSPPDCIVCAFPIIDVAYEVATYAQERKVPLIVDIRDLWPDTLVERFSGWKARLLRWCLMDQYRKARAALRKADSLIAISEGCLEWGLKLVGRPRTSLDRVFYTGYLDNEDADAGDGEGGLAELREKCRGKIVFAYVGSFGHSYELCLVADVAARMAGQGVERVHFVIAGDGEQREALRHKAGSLRNVTLTGWLNGRQLRDVLRLSHVGLVPCRSVVDAMPNKVFDYLAAGLPVVSSLEGEMARLISKHEIGLSYPCGDGEALYEAIMALGQDPNRCTLLGQNSGALFLARFQATKIYAEYAAHVEGIAGCRSRKSSSV